MTAKNQSFSMYAGDTKNIIVVVNNGNGTPLDLAGASIKWAVKRKVTEIVTDVSKTVSNGITITNGAGGEFTIALSPTDTLTLSGSYYHEAEVTDANGNVSTVLIGTLTVLPSGV